uniref:Venom protein family 5 protein 1 n=1 Tax=Pristhesancus plagipennis TaxID=1955184 RepID=A0A1Q1NPD8_PRIPG|nr:venom protein family 5 protein 1 [Pristhesancus plagipennis]
MRLLILSCMWFTFAFGSKHFNINEQIDGILPDFNKFLASKKLDSTLMPDFGYSAAPVFIGVNLGDLTTIYRTGDCEIWGDGDNLKIKMNLGLKNMKTNIFLVPYMRGPAALTFEGASAEIGVTLVPDGNNSCKTSWDYINLTTLGQVTSHSLNKEFDGKPLANEVLKDLIPYYNKHLNGNEMFSIKGLGEYINLCDQNGMVNTFRKFKTK